ncbi:MAG: hypothetical protein LUD81_00075 [Clostridiales bacterium]|nr:hypothetical protein [Clostridiales bacterium]
MYVNENMSMQPEGYTAKRNIKDSVFTKMFREQKYLLKLYQALHPEDTETTADDIKTITLEPVFVNDLTNDLGFEVKGKLFILVEAQSNMTVNIIVRSFMYLARTYQEHFEETGKDLYGTKPVEIPESELYVVYTGNKKIDKDIITLSEEFFKGKETAVEVRVNVITERNGRGIISQFITFSKVVDDLIKKYGRTAETVAKAIYICKNEDILKEFLEEHEKEVHDIMIILFDQEKAREIHENSIKMESEAKGIVKGRAEGREEGREEGKEDVAIEMLKGNVEPTLISRFTQLSLERINELKSLLSNTLQPVND